MPREKKNGVSPKELLRALRSQASINRKNAKLLAKIDAKVDSIDTKLLKIVLYLVLLLGAVMGVKLAL